MNIITSDWHLDHGNIMTYCGRTQFMNRDERLQYDQFLEGKIGSRSIRYSHETIGRMNDAIIDGVNAVAGPDDIVWNAGDVLFHGKDPAKVYARLLHFRKRIRAKKMFLIFGNHDDILDPEQNYKRDNSNVIVMDADNNPVLKDRKVALSEEEFATIFDRGFVRHTTYFKGTRFVIDHFANLVWRSNNRGVCMLYGHSHSNLEPWVAEHLPKSRMLDVGIDNRARLGLGYTPWTEDEILTYMKDKEGEAVDHHGQTK